MPVLDGYSGLWNSPLNNLQDVPGRGYTPKRSSIYCVVTDSMRDLVMVPLVPNFFETAYLIGKNTPYQRIYLVMPALDAIWITDAYLLYHELHIELGKDVEIISPSGAGTPMTVTDDFLAHLHVVGPNDQRQIVDYPDSDRDAEHCNIMISFPNWEIESMNRFVSDVCVSIGKKRILFCQYMNDLKLEKLGRDDEEKLYDEIHMPFIKTIYGGLTYLKARVIASSKIFKKLYAFGFQNEEEVKLMGAYGNRVGRVIFNAIV